MIKNKIFILVGIITVLFTFLFISGCQTGSITEEKILEQAQVARIIDGDTLELASGETVRLLHINTAEKGEFCYQEAKTKLAELVLNKTIFFERDMQSRDKYNRSLRYIYLSNNSSKSVNQMLVENGYAIAYILLPNTKYKNTFYGAEEQAIKNKIGCLWQNQSELRNCLKVLELKTCNEGDYIVLGNFCNSIALNGWTLRDQSRSRYLLSGIIGAGSSINITREGWKTTHDCIWNDYSSTLFVFDKQERLVLKHQYWKEF